MSTIIRSQNSNRTLFRIFDRQSGANNTCFDKYYDLEPKITVVLVARKRNQPANDPTISLGILS